MQKLLSYKQPFLIGILVIFYTVGIIGISLPSTKDQFLSLSFFNLLLSFTILLAARKSGFVRFFFFLTICFLYGIGVELIGTKTAYLFGSYYYGENLGNKFEGVPFVIGLNWGILVVGAASLVQRYKLSMTLKILLSALLMVILDLVMEPVAIKSDFWHWNSNYIPVFNYVSWFFVSLPLLFLYFKLNLVEENKVFSALFILLFIFFILLLIF